MPISNTTGFMVGKYIGQRVIINFVDDLVANDGVFNAGDIIIGLTADGEYYSTRYADGVLSYTELPRLDGSRVRTITTSDTATYFDDVIMVDATSGNVTVTLMAAVDIDKKLFIVRKDASANTVTIAADTGDTVDGSASITVAGDSYVGIASDGADSWYIISEEPGAGSGDVTGSGSSTDNAITRYDGTTGKLLQNSGATLDDSGNITANGANLSGETASRVAIFDSSKNIKSADTTTYPSLTEFSYVKGVTSSVQTQLDGKGYALHGGALAHNPADATTYYFGLPSRAPSTTNGISRVYIPRGGTIKKVYLCSYSGTAGDNTSWTMEIRINDTTSTNIATVSASTNLRVFSNTGLSISVNAGDYFEFTFTAPTWPTTNPGTTVYYGTVYIE